MMASIRLAIGLAVDEAANPANPFRHIDELDEVLLFHQLLQSAVDKTDGRPRLDHLLVFDDQIEMDRFGQDRVLRAKGDDGAGHKV